MKALLGFSLVAMAALVPVPASAAELATVS